MRHGFILLNLKYSHVIQGFKIAASFLNSVLVGKECLNPVKW